MKLVMNADGRIDHGDGSPISGGVFSILSAPDLFVRIDGVGVYHGNLEFSFTGGSAEGFVDGSVSGSGSIAATAQKTRVSGEPVVLLGDYVMMSASGTLESSGNPGTVSGPVEVVDAGQDKVRSG